ncbi:MAG: hypothetical protein AB7F86_18045 [Bdellovibrionales bacterium]
MKMQRTPNSLNLQITGSIGENSPFYTVPLGGLKEIVMDLAGVTSINSIGIKNWILWTLRIPKDCEVKLINCPFVIATQASMVVGFAPPNMKLESINMPFVCETCGAEQILLVNRGREYEYASGDTPAKIALPEGLPCPKCKDQLMEPDFLLEKTFKFLSM